MSSVDERVVSLKFDNQQFESGVKTSLGTLDKLKQGLNIEKSAKGLDGLKAGIGGFSMDGIARAAEATTKKFSVLGTIGDQVLRNLTNAAMSLGKSVMTAIPNQIVEGGKKRAQNIEQAQFMLQGLLKEQYNWDAISDDLDYAVKGTRYGMDAAAKAAAQLRASNIDFGQDMKDALRGISGVASMTNSEYEDISQIFTRVAGQGRVMATDLNSIAARGLNASAAIAEYMNKVNDGSVEASDSVKSLVAEITGGMPQAETDILKLTRTGKLNFEIFSKAMDSAFGEQAKKANETFSGAFANVKASLSRIGAQFATPAYEQTRLALVALIDVFNAVGTVAKQISPEFEAIAKAASSLAVDVFGSITKILGNEGLLTTVGNISKKISGFVIGLIGKLRSLLAPILGISAAQEKVTGTAQKAGKVLTKVFDPLRAPADRLKGIIKQEAEAIEGIKKTGETIKDINQWAKEVINGDYGNGEVRKKKLRELGVSYETVQNKVNELLGCSKRYKVEGSEANMLVAETAKDTEEAVSELTETQNNQVSEGNSLFDKLAITILGVVSAIKIVTKVGKELVTKILIPIGKIVGGAILKTLLTLTSKIGAKLIEINKSFEENNSIEKFFDSLKGYLRNIRDFFSAVANTEGIGKLVESLTNLWTVLKETFGQLLDFVIEKVKLLPGLFTSAFGEPSIENAAQFVGNIADFLSKIVDILAARVTDVKNFFGAFKFDTINFTAIKDFFVNLANTDGVKRLGQAFKGLKDLLVDIGSKILGKVVEKLQQIPSLFQGFGASDGPATVSSVLEKIAEFLAIIIEAVTGNVGAIRDFFGAFKIEGDFSSKFEALKNLFDTIKDVSAGKFQEIADGIKNLFSAGGDDSKLGNTSKVLSSVTGIFDRVAGDPKEIKAKSSASVSAFGEGLLDGLSKINFDTVLKGAKIGAFLYIILQIAQTFRNVKDTSKNISDFTGSFSKFTKSLTKIPEGVTGVLDKMKETLGSYQTQLRADILFKVAAAIGILALSLIALSFVPSDKLANAAVDLALVVGVVALLILAISKLMKAKPEVTEKKENPYAEAINNFLTGISTALDNALKTLSKAGAFLMIAAAIGILVKAFMDLGQANMTVDQATQAVIGIIAVSLLLVYLVGIMNQIASDFTTGSAASILAIGVAIKLISDVVLSLGAIKDPSQLAQGIGGVITLMGMLAIAAQAMGKAGPNVTKASAAIIIMTGALALIVPLVVLLGVVSKVALPGLILLIGLGGAMIAFSAAMSAIGTTFGKQGNSMFKGAAMMLALAGAIAILAPMLVLLGAVAGIAFKGIGVLAAGLAVLIAAAAVTAIPAVTAGLTALTTAITAFGLAMLETGVGVLAFAVGVAILVPIVKSVLSGVGEALSHLPEMAATVISGIGQIFSMIWQAIVTYAPVLFNNLMQLIGQIPGWLVSQLPTIIAGLVSVVIQIDVALINLLASIPALLWGIIKGIAQGVVQGIAASAGPIGDALKGLLMGFINLIVDGLGGLISKIPGTEWITDKLEGWRKGMQEKLKPSEAKKTGEDYTKSLVNGAKDGTKGFTGVTTEISKVAGKTTKELGKQGDLAGEEYGHHLQYAVKQGRVDLEKETSDTASGMFEAFTSGNFDWSQAGEMINSDLFTGLQNGMEGMSGDFGNLFNGELTSGLESIDVSDATGDIGKAVNEGVGDGVSSTMNLAIDPTKEMAEQLPEEFRSMLGINSPSKVFSDLGRGIPEGTAKGISQATPQVQRTVTLMAMNSLKTMQSIVPQFALLGQKMGSSLASGLRAASGAVRSAASSLGSAAKSGVGDVYNAMRSKGQDAGAGYARGIRDKIPEIRSAAKAASDAGRIKMAKSDDSHSPSRKYRKLGHYAMDGYILGFRDRIKNVGAVATTASRAGIDATKGALKSMSDAISGNMDLDPTIRPVLDLTDIKNGAGMINSLLPNGSVGLGLAVAGTAPGAAYRMTNEDVVSAINGLRNDLINNPQTVNNYSMGDVTYDDGTNVATAVRSLIRAARTERRV